MTQETAESWEQWPESEAEVIRQPKLVERAVFIYAAHACKQDDWKTAAFMHGFTMAALLQDKHSGMVEAVITEFRTSMRDFSQVERAIKHFAADLVQLWRETAEKEA